MSLRFVIGRSGTGKTTKFLREIEEELIQRPSGRPILYIVPDQMTFLSEYRLVNFPRLTGMIRTQVFSFTRLAWRVLQETGGASRKHISSTGLNMLIRKIIEDHKDDLRLFRKAADKSGFVQHVEGMLKEFKNYCITPNELQAKQEELAFSVSTRELSDKIHDLELIYGKFEEALIGKYIDSNDYLTLLTDAIEKSNYLRDAEIYIDGFHDFTPQEYQVIEKLMSHCHRVSVALTLDRPYKYGTIPEDLHLFRITGETYSVLFELARNINIEIEEDVYLAETPRFQDDSLQHLEHHFEKRPVKPFNDTTAIQLKVAANRRAEIEGVAREIRKLLMDYNYRYQDIAVLMRNGQDYQDIIETIFYDYEIPYFIDRKRPMLNHPLIELIRSMLEVIHSNWRYEPVFRAVKTDLLFPLHSNIPQMREQMDRLENYVLAYGIKGNRWTEKTSWTYRRFQGFELESLPQTDAEKALEDEINESRNIIVEPISFLTKRLKNAQNGRELCEAIYVTLEELNIPEKLAERGKVAEEKGDLTTAREHEQAWNAVIELLDQFVEIFGEARLSMEESIAIIDAGLEASQFSLIPPAIDQVFIADIELSRVSNIKAAFVIGLNDGVMPAKKTEEGVLSEDDRTELISSGLTIAPTIKKKLFDEEFIAYRAFTVSEQKLYVSFPLANEEGKALLPSPYIKRLKELFPHMQETNVVNEPSELAKEDQLEYISHPNTAIAFLTGQLQLLKRNYPIADFWWDVYNFYMQHPNEKLKARRVLSSLYYQNETRRLKEETSKELYGEEMLASVSRMENFHGCAFAHFSSYGLKLRERDMYRLEAPHIGELFHGALKWIAEEVARQGLSWAKLTKEQCDRLAKGAVESLAPKLLNQILLSSNRHNYIKRKLEQVISRASFALSNQAKNSDFTPIGLELAFGPRNELPPLSFVLNNGTKMQLQGRIDRVDKAEDENGVYLRVIDYKSSNRAIDLTEVYHGLALQMLTYLDIVITHSSQLIGMDAAPAGVLYFHVHNPMINSENMLSLDEIENELLKKFKMQGLLLSDANIIRLMDNSLETGSSNIINASINKDGSLSSRSKANTANPDEFKVLRKYVRNMYKKSGEKIMSGTVDINPYRLGNRTPCQFCAFKSVCQIDPSFENNQYRPIIRQSSADIFAQLREEGDND